MRSERDIIQNYYFLLLELKDKEKSLNQAQYYLDELRKIKIYWLKTNLCTFERINGDKQALCEEIGIGHFKILNKEGRWIKSTWHDFERHMRYRLDEDYEEVKNE